MDDLPGLDLDALSGWMDDQQPDLRAGPLRAEILAGGKSNLTYRVTDGQAVWALRRPPLAHVLPTAHDMAREYRVIAALVGTDVPVPRPVALCADPEILGAPFYLMDFVAGVVLDRPDDLARLEPVAAAGVCGELADTLVRLHAIEPAAVGLGDFGRPDGFLTRQLKRWHGQWQASQTQPRSIVNEVVGRLGSTMPRSAAAGIVHGDYRLTNVIFGPDHASVAAVLDWEMATLGDPLTDVELLLVYQTLAADGDLIMPTMRPSDGFYTRDQWVARYAAGSSLNLSDLDWYVGFGYFKLAVIAEGIHHRYQQGMTVGAGFDQMGPAVPGLLQAAMDHLRDRRPTTD